MKVERLVVTQEMGTWIKIETWRETSRTFALFQRAAPLLLGSLESSRAPSKLADYCRKESWILSCWPVSRLSNTASQRFPIDNEGIQKQRVPWFNHLSRDCWGWDWAISRQPAMEKAQEERTGSSRWHRRHPGPELSIKGCSQPQKARRKYSLLLVIILNLKKKKKNWKQRWTEPCFPKTLMIRATEGTWSLLVLEMLIQGLEGNLKIGVRGRYIEWLLSADR